MSIERLLANNEDWAKGKVDADSAFFERLVGQQNPDYLWIGCSDSRVPANEIVGLDPGEVFVHRNIANVVVHTDLNLLSVLQYAVDVLQVEHVIVCGHYGCGGIAAADDNNSHGLIDNWLQHIEDVVERHEDILGSLSGSERHDRLCELNVLAQVRNVARTTVMQSAWARGQDVTVHGLIYRLSDGRLRRIGASINSQARLADWDDAATSKDNG